MRHPDLEIDLLRAFVAVVDAGSFTAAADLVGRSQSAVSQKVLRLEEILQLRLFDRTSRSLRLTAQGERLLASARQMLEFNDRLVADLRSPLASGTLRLGISEDFIPQQLPRLLARFSRLYPAVHLELMTGLSCALLSAYDEGRLDAVIAKKDGTAQRGRVIWREQLVWMAAADQPLDLSGPLRLVMLPAPCTYRELMVSALGRNGRDWVAACTASSLMGVQAAVAGGLGVTVLGRCFLRDGLRILPEGPDWPSLPQTEITVVGEDRAGDLVRPLVGFLTESLAGGAGMPVAA
jgi:DNA-binding transcriptional LysR family regulator